MEEVIVSLNQHSIMEPKVRSFSRISRIQRVSCQIGLSNFRSVYRWLVLQRTRCRRTVPNR